MTLAVDQPIISDPYQEPTRWWGGTDPGRGDETRGVTSPTPARTAAAHSSQLYMPTLEQSGGMLRVGGP